MSIVHVELTLTSYIAHPFWPDKNLCIDIEKTSGVNRQKSDDKRKTALESECDKRGMTYADYLAAKKRGEEQWYRKDGMIIIPRHQLSGAIVQTIGGAPKNLRGEFTKDTFRSIVQIGDFTTDRKDSDGKFERFVKLEGSNQRSLQSNDYIGIYLDQGEVVRASGVLSFPDDPKTGATVKALFVKATETTGVGAARKMGFGRGIVSKWESAK